MYNSIILLFCYIFLFLISRLTIKFKVQNKLVNNKDI